VLVASTIIESGLDIPSANTMIVEEAEDFGLAQLYQLRGRIGREKQKAYCYLFFSKGAISENASKRLQALYEFSELGSGFRLALRDTEIRGAGNILGAEQHGFVKEVGFELFSRLLAEASPKVRTASAAKPEEEFTPELSFQAPALLPDDYIEGEDIRIGFYRKLATVKTPEDLAKIRYELTDRFGALPESAQNLFAISDLRIIARNNRIAAVTESDENISVYFSRFIKISPENIIKLADDYANSLEFMRGEKSGVKFKKSALGIEAFRFVKEFLLKISKYAIISA
jgi:transcription-repair coupling factor (superfamily II helicase)